MTHQYMEIKIKELENRVKALEQEPCEETLRIEEIKDILRRGCTLTVKESQDLYKYIEALEQEPKTRYWMDTESEVQDEYSD